MKELNFRQKLIYDLLCELAVDKVLKITNNKLSLELLDKLKISGRDGKPLSGPAVAKHLSIFQKKELIELQPGSNTRERIILIK